MPSELREAQNPQTSAERLKELSLDTSAPQEVTRALGLNPNTPFVCLEGLWRKHPECFWQNPVVALLQLEDPDFYSRLSVETLQSLVQRPEVELELLQHAASRRRPDLACSIAKSPSASPELLHELLAVSHYYSDALLAIAQHPKAMAKTLAYLVGASHVAVRVVARSHPSLAPELVSILHLLAAYDQKEYPTKVERRELYLLARCGPFFREMLVGHPELTPALTVALLLGGEHPICQALSNQEEAPLLAAICESSDRSTQLAQLLAKHPSTPGALLEWLAQKRPDVLTCLAQNPNLPEALFRQLSSLQDEASRLALLRNPNLPEEALQKILSDHNPKLISAGLQHPKTRLGMLSSVFLPERWRLRACLARESRTPSYLVDLLLEDESEEVSESAERHGNATPTAVDRMSRLKEKRPLQQDEIEYFMGRLSYPRRLLLVHPQCPASLVEEFIQHTEQQERIFLAKETRDPAVLARLSSDFWCSSVVLHNPASTPDILRLMYKAEHHWCWSLLAGNARTPPDILEALYQTRHANVLPHLAANPACPKHILGEIIKMNDHGLLSMVGRNPGAPADIYQRLPHIKLCYIQQNIALQCVHLSGASPHSFPLRVLRALASAKSSDEAFLLWVLGRHEFSLAEHIAANPNTPTRVLEALYLHRRLYHPDETNETLHRMIVKHPNAPATVKAP